MGLKNIGVRSLDEFQTLKYTDIDSYDRLRGFYRYRETNPTSVIRDYGTAEKLRAAGVKGRIHIPPEEIDIDSLEFDAVHVALRHSVNEEQAKAFIKNAKLSITKWRGTSKNY